MSRSRGLVTVALVALIGALLPRPIHARTVTKNTTLGQVRFILHGLAVQAPKHAPGKGKLREPLYGAYQLSTKHNQKASISFRDGSLLHLNQLTNAVLKSSSLTQVKSGEVEQQVVPGTSHQIQTAAAVAAAIGTIFDVKVKGKITIITVVEGSVLVKTKHGNVVVTSQEQVRIKKGKAPSTPVVVDTSVITDWTAVIPPPAVPLGVNIALDANGGNVYRASSQRESSDHAFDPGNINDGRLNRGWQSAMGQTSGQAIWLRFQGERAYRITTIALDCAATGGEAASNDAKDFVVKVSTTTTDEGAFTSVMSGVCLQRAGIQVFVLPHAVQATYVELDFTDNYGGSDGIAVAEAEVISSDMPSTLGTPTPVPTDTPTLTPTDTPTATATPVPLFTFSFTGLHTTFTTPPFNSMTSIGISGQACGADPLSSDWTVTTNVQASSPNTFVSHNTFATTNPYTTLKETYSVNGSQVGSDSTSLRLDAGPPAQMTLLVETTGGVSNVVVNPSVVPVTTGARCG